MHVGGLGEKKEIVAKSGLFLLVRVGERVIVRKSVNRKYEKSEKIVEGTSERPRDYEEGVKKLGGQKFSESKARSARSPRGPLRNAGGSGGFCACPAREVDSLARELGALTRKAEGLICIRAERWGLWGWVRPNSGTSTATASGVYRPAIT